MTFSIDLTGTMDIALGFINALWAAYALPLSFVLLVGVIGLVWFLFQRVVSYVHRGSGDE